uniref:Pogo transposable element derived with ZNF domain b n=1 Tax=Echeneis naucrates TaxID=173247 RepID=A0A665T9X9_ECHNA
MTAIDHVICCDVEKVLILQGSRPCFHSNMDTELFMECEEEELEPWQQVEDSVEEDDMDFDYYSEPGERYRQTHKEMHTNTHTSSSNGFPVQTVVNRGAPLLLNLQGQTVQPLTLIQCKTRPLHWTLNNNTIRQGPNTSRSSTQPSSTFTTMQLPATLTIRTSTPRPGSPALPSDSANGVTRVTTMISKAGSDSGVRFLLQIWLTFIVKELQEISLSPPCSLASPGPTRSVTKPPSVTSVPPTDPPRVVMSVEEFYYGTFEGDLSLRKPHPLGIKTSTFTCQICTHLAENNLRLMQHMLQHSELIGGGGDERKCCRFCYRQFSSPAQLQTHQDQVHGPAQSSSMCRICEWAFENEPAFLNHMKSNHKPGEMPYVCQVCSYRSSFYSDVLQHFASFHRDSRFLLCVFCLKVTRNHISYQQHLLRHQINQAFHCNRCRLQFIFLKDKMQHKLENHRSFRRPAQLEGLPPGSKVTPPPSSSQSSSRQKCRRHRSRETLLSPSPSGPLLDLSLLVSCRSSSSDGEHVVCLECGTDASDFSAHYPTHVHCLLCRYSSCCSRAYAAHMIHVFLLQCSQCDLRPHNGDLMAAHLMDNPGHTAICWPRSKRGEGGQRGRQMGRERDTHTLLQDMDFSDDEQVDELDDPDEESEDIKEEIIKEVKYLDPQPLSAPKSHTQPATVLYATKERDDFLSARQLRIALFALCDGLRQASRVFSTETQLIRKWLKEARRCLKRTEQEHGEDRMVAWVLSMREQQLPITESNLFHKASMLKKKGGFSNSFRISYDWAVSFMLQQRLGVRSIGMAPTLTHTLPASLEAKIKSFREFTQKIIQVHQLSESAIAAMDELCLFVDLRLVQDKTRRSEALELTGSLPLVTMYLTVLANGTMLPSLVLANRQLAEKVLPECILLEAGQESLLVEEALDLWTNKVWLQHISGLSQLSKSMLVVDRHREHMGDQFLTSISGSGTLPAVIPGGCSFCLQPLDICVKPVLQRLIMSRWAKFTAEDPIELEETSPHRLQANVAELLVDWVVEALTLLNKCPQLWKKSFRLTDLLLNERMEAEEGRTRQKPEEIQLDLLKTLTEKLFGAKILGVSSPDLLELEDEEDIKVECIGCQRKETSDEDKEKKILVKENERELEEKSNIEDMRSDKKDEGETPEVDSEDEGKVAEDSKEVIKERRETRIVTGEDVGDEWKIKSRTEGEGEDEEDSKEKDSGMDKAEELKKTRVKV